MYDRFTDRARKVMQFAGQEAQRRNHEQMGTEHILLGLIREEHGLAATTLTSLGIDFEKADREVQKIAPAGHAHYEKMPPASSAAKKALINAFEEVKRMKLGFVDTEHLLLGLIRITDSKAAHVLTAFELTPDAIREHIAMVLHHDRPVIADADDDDMSDSYDTRATVKRIKPIMQAVKESAPLAEREPSIAAPPSMAQPSIAAQPSNGTKPPAFDPDSTPGVIAGSLPVAANNSPAIGNRGPWDDPGPKPAEGAALLSNKWDPAHAGPAARVFYGPQATDHAVRQAISLCWATLPDGRKNVIAVESEIRRLVERALRDLAEDAQAFGLE